MMPSVSFPVCTAGLAPASDASRPIFVVAGEHSGDILGAALIRGLKTAYPQVSFCGVGGPRMEDTGSFASIFPMSDLSVMGFGPVLKNAPRLIKRFYQTLAAIRQTSPVGVLTIDSTSFCLRLGRKIKNIPRIQCVAPAVWAWKTNSATTVVPYSTDHLLSLFPFEEPYFRHMPYSFIGHPICSQVKGNPRRFWEKYGPERPLLCLLPGSRQQEIQKFWPVFSETARRLRCSIPNLLVATVCAPGSEVFWPKSPDLDYVMVPHTEKSDLFAGATLALAASGSVTLELAHQGTPMIIGYKVPKSTEWILRHRLRSSVVGLINIVAGETFVPEYLQENFTPDILSAACMRFFQDPALRHGQSKKSLCAIQTLWAGGSFEDMGAACIGKAFGLDRVSEQQESWPQHL